jgi:hypothetical protein
MKIFDKFKIDKEKNKKIQGETKWNTILKQ